MKTSLTTECRQKTSRTLWSRILAIGVSVAAMMVATNHVWPGDSSPPEKADRTNDLPGNARIALDDKQKLGVGDRISFRVLEDREDPKLLTVTDAGELDIPELGFVAAVGKTCKELAGEITPRLEQTAYYRATVVIGIDLLNKTSSGRKVYVVGQVRLTGPQEIPAGETWTVSRAIMKAGGFTEYADKKRVRLIRGGSGSAGQTSFINVSDILEHGRTDLDKPLLPEDLIYIPARAVNFY